MEEMQTGLETPKETSKNMETGDVPKKKLSKKPIYVIGAAAAVLIIAVIVAILATPSKFERVRKECVHIAGIVSGEGDFFKLETKPDSFDNLDSTTRDMMAATIQEGVLEAIQYANKEFGFPDSVYSDMLNTNALMGRQTEENSKYKVSWTYHPDDGLTVTYTKK